MPPLLGLFSWIVVGLAAGLAARPLLPGEPPLGWGMAGVTGLGGAVAGGLLATALGFGGLAGFDARALTVATLGAILGLLLLRTARLAA